MCAEDLVRCGVNDDLCCGGGFGYPVGGVPVAGVGGPDGDFVSHVSGFVLEKTYAVELRDGEHGGGTPVWSGAVVVPLIMLGAATLPSNTATGRERTANRVRGVAGGEHGGVGGALQIGGDSHTAWTAGDTRSVQMQLSRLGTLPAVDYEAGVDAGRCSGGVARVRPASKTATAERPASWELPPKEAGERLSGLTLTYRERSTLLRAGRPGPVRLTAPATAPSGAYLMNASHNPQNAEPSRAPAIESPRV